LHIRFFHPPCLPNCGCSYGSTAHSRCSPSVRCGCCQYCSLRMFPVPRIVHVLILNKFRIYCQCSILTIFSFFPDSFSKLLDAYSPFATVDVLVSAHCAYCPYCPRCPLPISPIMPTLHIPTVHAVEVPDTPHCTNSLFGPLWMFPIFPSVQMPLLSHAPNTTYCAYSHSVYKKILT
jgi:hypothetical protein